MEFTFLGTSAGTPTKMRNVTGLAIQHGGPRGWYLVDCGEGTQHQLLHTRYSLQQLRAIFITHVHGDHSYGLPGLLASASMAGRTEPLPLVAPAPVRKLVDAAFAMSGSTLGYALEFIETGADDFAWSDPYVSVETVALSHRVPCHAFVFSERNLEKKLLPDRLEADGVEAGPVWGQLQQGRDVVLEGGRRLRSSDYTAVTRRPRRLIVGGDNDSPELLRDACREAQVLIHEATYTQAISEKVGPGPQHSSAAQVGRFAASVDLPNLVLTHFSPRYQASGRGSPSVDEIAGEVRAYYGGPLWLARDLDSYRLNKDLSLMRLGDPEPAGTVESEAQELPGHR